MKLNLGCGNNLLDGYINVDKYDVAADVMADICYLPYDNDSVDEIVCYQVIEHLPYWQTSLLTNNIGVEYKPQFFEECYRVLKPGGTLLTECPDIEFIAKRITSTGNVSYNDTINLYGEYYRPWDTGRYPDWEHQAGSLHITAFTWNKVKDIAEYVGFQIKKNSMEEKHRDYKYEENLSVLWTKPQS